MRHTMISYNEQILKEILIIIFFFVFLNSECDRKVFEIIDTAIYSLNTFELGDFGLGENFWVGIFLLSDII